MLDRAQWDRRENFMLLKAQWGRRKRHQVTLDNIVQSPVQQKAQWDKQRKHFVDNSIAIFIPQCSNHGKNLRIVLM